MTLDVLAHRGCPLEQQRFTWRDLVAQPFSKLDDDAFTRVRVLLMVAIESDALRFQHAAARTGALLREPLARMRRVEQHQATMVGWLVPPDQSLLETAVAIQQTAVEVGASIAMAEPDPYLAQVHRFGLLEDLDHLYRFAALLDRLEGKDANNILQGQTDVVPGRPAADEHRAPQDDVREHHGTEAAPISRVHAALAGALQLHAHDFCMHAGPQFADPVARQLFAEIASLEEQQATQYASLSHPGETWLGQWLIHEAMEAHGYHSCVEQESNPRLKAIWERFLDYELGHVGAVAELLTATEGRDSAEVLATTLPGRIEFRSHRDFVRQVLDSERSLSACDGRIVPVDEESPATLDYRRQMNARGSPSTAVAMRYRWTPGTELTREAARL